MKRKEGEVWSISRWASLNNLEWAFKKSSKDTQSSAILSSIFIFTPPEKIAFDAKFASVHLYAGY